MTHQLIFTGPEIHRASAGGRPGCRSHASAWSLAAASWKANRCWDASWNVTGRGEIDERGGTELLITGMAECGCLPPVMAQRRLPCPFRLSKLLPALALLLWLKTACKIAGPRQRPAPPSFLKKSVLMTRGKGRLAQAGHSI